MANQEPKTDIPLSNAGSDTAKIQRVQVTVPTPFQEGHQLRPNEAQALNEHYISAIRNGVGPKVKEQLKQDGALDADGNLVDSSKINTKAVQKLVDEYVQTYDFGQAGTRTADPIEQEAMSIARGLVQDAITKRGGRVTDYGAKAITQKAKEILQDKTKGPKIRQKAEEVVKSRSELGDIDI